MLTKEQNDMLTRVGPGTPGGEMLRRYWTPAALSVEVPPDGAPLPVRLFGEDRLLEINVTSEHLPARVTWEEYRAQRSLTLPSPLGGEGEGEGVDE